MRFVRLWLLICISAFVLSVGSAQAHSEVFERAPAIGQVVSGEVGHVDISFWLEVTDTRIQLIDPNGDEVAVSEAELADNLRLTSIEFEPLSVEGRYTVNHAELSVDGDIQQGTFSFVYAATGGEELASLVLRGSGPNWPLLGLVFGVVLFLAGIFWPKPKPKSEAPNVT